MPMRERIESIDWVRGTVMVIMALDHVRDYFSDRLLDDPTDLKTTSAALFLTRWITHFCAPTFIFLAGTSAFLAGQRRTRAQLSWFLLTRGLWLAVFEITVNRALWMFNYDWHHHGAGVFWAIGWAMAVLSALVFLPSRVVAYIGMAMIGLHNLLDGMFAEQFHLPGWIWMILHSPAEELRVAGDFWFGTGYCLIPWTGVMALGYGFGSWWLLDRGVRRPRIIMLGVVLTLLFVVVRAINVHGDPNPWAVQSTPLFTVLSFLNCTKYPASLDYLLMTLGPAILFLGLMDRPLGDWAAPIITFGRVPLFYYVLHIILIHGGVVLLDYARFGWSPLAGAGPWELKKWTVPPGYGVSLPVVYAIWIVLLLLLYPPCRWYADVKKRHRSPWLSYL